MGRNNQGFTYEYVSDFYRANGCTLLAPTYANARTNMEYICECGEVGSTTFDHFKRGTRCFKCSYDKRGDKQRLSHDDVSKFFDDNNCVLLSEYRKHTNKINYICSCGNHAITTFNNFRKGHRCGHCGWNKRLTTMYEKGTAPTSTQQLHIHSIINGELNYPVDRCMLDIAFPDEMIYVEYDGGGHDLSAKLGVVTYQEFYHKEEKRSAFLHSLGWRCVRIVCPHDNLPCDADIYFSIKFAKEYLIHNSDKQVMIEW